MNTIQNRPAINLTTLITFCLMMLPLWSGCDDEGGGASNPMVRVGGEMVAGEMMAGATVAGEVMAGEGGAGEEIAGEAMAGETMAGEMTAGTMSRVRTIDDCEQLCAVYEMCDLSELNPWGTCLEGCLEEDWNDQGFRSYVSCLKVEACESLEGCQIPPSPLPSCNDACAALEVCETDFRLPMALTQTGNCATACTDPSWSQQISQCVQANERRLCEDRDFFDLCILERRGGECAEICEARSMCDDELDFVECTLSCLAEAPEEDDLAEYYRQQERRCVTEAANCEAVDTCLAPAAAPRSEAIEETCELAEGCELFSEGACPDRAADVLRELSEEGVRCLNERLTQDCDQDLTECFTQTRPISNGDCGSYCFSAATCGLLPEGQSEFDCIEECNQVVDSGDQTELADYQARFACAEVRSCNELNQCIAGVGNNDSCAELCAQRSSCGSEDETACLDRCNARFSSERSRRERICGQLLSCERADQCVIPPAPNCDDYCEPLVACGEEAGPCLTRCDNAELADPEGHIARLTCVNASERCDLLSTCEDDTSAATACLAYCAYQAGCETGTELGQPTEACALSCARGELTGDDAITFAGASTCLAEQPTSPNSCADVEACFAPLTNSCEALCAESFDCLLPFTGQLASDCVSACEGGAFSDSELACGVLASSRAEGCEGLALCLNYPLPEPTPACENYCDALKACDPSTDLYLCHTECLNEIETDGIRDACSEIADCSTIDRCQDELVEVSANCQDACANFDMNCDGSTGSEGRFTDLRACEERCAGVALALEDEAGEVMSECINEAMCDSQALDLCFSGELTTASDEICARSLNAITQCGFFDFLMVTEQQFLAQCALDYAADPMGTVSQVECLEMEYQNDPSCFSAILSCGLF